MIQPSAARASEPAPPAMISGTPPSTVAIIVMVTGRKSVKSLYRNDLVTFEDDRGAYDQKDAEGFIRLNGLRLRTLAARRRKS